MPQISLLLWLDVGNNTTLRLELLSTSQGQVIVRQVHGEGTLKWPDFVGNNLFSTLGASSLPPPVSVMRGQVAFSASQIYRQQSLG